MEIHVNQVGYLSKGEKRAVLTAPAETFWLEDLEGTVVFRGRTKHFGYDKSSGDQVTTADFSEYEIPGFYRVCAEEDGAEMRSPGFAIGERVYDGLIADLMKAYYYLRCGCGLGAECAGKYVHGVCHAKPAKLWDDHAVLLDVSGGWHDAGDYGRYITPGACALAHLFYAYKMFPDTMISLKWKIPESGNGVPDLLNECRYELEWFLKMQRPDGGVYHKASTAEHAAFVMPEEDLEQLYVLPVSSMATADLAAVCACASSLYERYDGAFANRLKEAAGRSYRWLKEHPQFVGFQNPEGCRTGEYGEWSDDSNRFWAAAELYALTGEQCYHEDMVRALEKPFPPMALGYGEVGGFGILAYLLCGRGKDEALRERFLENIVQAAAQRVRVSEECGYGVAMKEWEYFWGSNMSVMQHGMLFAIADHFGLEERVLEASKDAPLPKKWRRPGEPEEEAESADHRERRGWGMRDHAAAELDYLLGLNAMGTSYVTGNGEKAYRYPHLRPAHADGIEECMPGMVSGGPSGIPMDPVAKELLPAGTPPMKGYADHYMCYSLNEITIYWNSPAVFVTAYLMDRAAAAIRRPSV